MAGIRVYCSGCGSVSELGSDQRRVCGKCLLKLEPCGYCGKCGKYLSRPVGSSCPEHGIVLVDVPGAKAAAAETEEKPTSHTQFIAAAKVKPKDELEFDGAPQITMGQATVLAVFVALANVVALAILPLLAAILDGFAAALALWWRPSIQHASYLIVRHVSISRKTLVVTRGDGTETVLEDFADIRAGKDNVTWLDASGRSLFELRCGRDIHPRDFLRLVDWAKNSYVGGMI
jgi:hypothetical protein